MHMQMCRCPLNWIYIISCEGDLYSKKNIQKKFIFRFFYLTSSTNILAPIIAENSISSIFVTRSCFDTSITIGFLAKILSSISF